MDSFYYSQFTKRKAAICMPDVAHDLLDNKVAVLALPLNEICTPNQ
jgi:hypothetical protein